MIIQQINLRLLYISNSFKRIFEAIRSIGLTKRNKYKKGNYNGFGVSWMQIYIGFELELQIFFFTTKQRDRSKSIHLQHLKDLISLSN